MKNNEVEDAGQVANTVHTESQMESTTEASRSDSIDAEKSSQDTQDTKPKSSLQERFAALKKRATESSRENRKELYNEHKASKENARLKARLEQKKLRAELELEKIEAEENGEDYERRRAWDYTIDESEKWDEKQREKAERMAGAGFSDYAVAAERAYYKDLKNFDIEAAKRERSEETEETDDPFSHKPSKEALDRLVKGLRKGDDQRTKRRKKQDDDSGVTYINEKNKQFNEKLSRHYDKYTKDTRDAVE